MNEKKASSIQVPPKGEKREVRKGLMLTPSLAEKAESRCKTIGVSFNEAVNQLIEKWVSEN